jgi:hypothetical protein
MTKPPRSKKAKVPRDVVADLAALGPDMAALAAAFTLKKPDAMERAAFMRDVEEAKAQEAARAGRVPGADAEKHRAANLRHEGRRRAIESVMAYYSRLAMTWREDEGPTPEKRLQKAWDRDPILVLLESGKITPDQAKAARHMAAVFHGMTAAIMPRIGKMDPTPGAPRDSGWKEPMMSGWAWSSHSRVYKPWADDMLPRAGVPLVLMVEICIDGHALNTVATRHRLWHRTVLKLLRKGLDLYDNRLRSHGGKSDREFTMSDLPAHLLEHKDLTSEPAPIPPA